MTETRIVRVPSPSMPISMGIESIIQELEYYDLDASPLKGIPLKLSCQITTAAGALQVGDRYQVNLSLREAHSTLREATIALKMVRITTKNRMPTYVSDHLLLMKSLIESALDELFILSEPMSRSQSPVV
ncbi:MAG: hypothetical protein LUO82_05805 [Methanomicrobiales archaeon]|nr:hypothetical protein [Methanomicrobiales archaeon]